MPERTEVELPAAITTAENLPSVPGVALEVLRLSKLENAGIDAFADAIARDPALSAKLLKISNSALFSPSHDVTTLKQATLVLGLKTVQLMSLSFSLASSLPRTGALGSFHFSEYWRRSLVASVAARSFCKLLGSKLGDEAFLCGLLSKIGQLVMVQCLPADYERVLVESADWPDAAIERRLLGFDHNAVGAALLESWELPELIHRVVADAEHPEELPEGADGRVRELCWILRMASLTVQILCDTNKGEPLRALHGVVAEHGLSSEQVDAFLVGLESGIRETAELLDLEFDDGANHAQIVSQAREQVMRISLGAVVSLQHLESENQKLSVVAATDKLTGIANRAYFDKFLEVEVERRMAADAPNALGLLMLDVDRFKLFNDTYGHRTGDRVLRIVGNALKKATRESDLVARFGGEEFAIVVLQSTPFSLRAYAERVRETIEDVAIPLDDGSTVKVTVSIGGACLRRALGPGDADALVEAADRELYRGKVSGRNRVEIAADPLNFAE